MIRHFPERDYSNNVKALVLLPASKPATCHHFGRVPMIAGRGPPCDYDIRANGELLDPTLCSYVRKPGEEEVREARHRVIRHY
jgi:hypothetical protein